MKIKLYILSFFLIFSCENIIDNTISEKDYIPPNTKLIVRIKNTNKFKNIRSPKMLKLVLKLLNSNNYFINNLDINLICEQPKISKHRDKIINSLSNLLDLNKELINLKGKTTEKLGLVGKEKAIACEVICSISK